MSVYETPTFQFLHRHGEWPGFVLSGLEVAADGSLRLAALPILSGAPDAGQGVSGLEGPAGVSSDECGNLWVADARNHRILRIDSCDDSQSVLGCLQGPGRGPGELLSPHGVLSGPRNALYIADTGNRRVLVVDRVTEQLRGVWGRAAAGLDDLQVPGTFAEPWDLASDSRERIYVADPGFTGDDGVRRGGRVQRFMSDGRVDASFADAIASLPGVFRARAPIGVVSILLDAADPASERLLVLDAQPARLLAYSIDGRPDAEATARWERAIGHVESPSALATRDDAIYVADAMGGRLVSFGTSGDFRGVRRTPTAGAAGLAFDCKGRLVLHVGGGGDLLMGLGVGGFAECGTFLAGPIAAPSMPTRWQRLELGCETLAAGAHLNICTLTSNTLDGSPGQVPSPPLTCGTSSSTAVQAASLWDPAPLDTWRSAPIDATDFLCLNAPGEYLWIAGRLEGDATVTPIIRQIQIGFDQVGWLQHLPALFTRNAVAQRYLERFLALFDGMLDAEQDLLDKLPEYFDPWAAPDEAPRPTWLEWLGGWLDARLNETASGPERREIVARAFREHARRGTVRSLQRLVARATGATPIVTELGIPGPWALGETPLGFESALAPAAPQPAVVNSTAIVNASSLLRDEDIGVSAFEPYAHRFTVEVPMYALRPNTTLSQVALVVDREKPAHTTYALCGMHARARVGVAARVGMDAIVAGPPLPSPLGGDSVDGFVLADGGTAHALPRVGTVTAS